jgi:hypothetical protein
MPRHAGKRPRKHERTPATGPSVPPRNLARLAGQRHRLAQEAARLIAEDGLHDYQQARLKAAQRLGIADRACQPRHQDIEEALREYQRLFRPDTAAQSRRRREAALQAMAFFEPFQPRLAGAVLEGTADAHSPVELHLHDDDADAVARHLQQHAIPADSGSRRLRLDRQRSGEFPVWRFSADDIAFELTVLPLAQLRQPPLGATYGNPIPRASATRVRQLLADEDIGARGI